MESNELNMKVTLVSILCVTLPLVFAAKTIFSKSVGSKEIPGGRVGATYSLILPAKGGVPPYKWTIIRGTLPPGLSLSENGVLSGKFEKAGDYAFEIQVIDARGEKTSGQAKIRVEPPLTGIAPLKFRTHSLPNAVEGKPYQLTFAAEGGLLPYQWAVEGTLPKGLQLNPETGEITGTPEQSGESKFRVRVKDSQGNAATDEQELVLSVIAPGKTKRWFEHWLVVLLLSVVILWLFLTRKPPQKGPPKDGDTDEPRRDLTSHYVDCRENSIRVDDLQTEINVADINKPSSAYYKWCTELDATKDAISFNLYPNSHGTYQMASRLPFSLGIQVFINVK